MGKRLKFTKDSGNRRLALAEHTVVIIEAGKTVNNKSVFRCNKCGYEWSAVFSNIIRGHGCPKCNGGVKVNEEACRLQMVGKTFTMLRYGGSVTSKSLFKCNICSSEWLTDFDKIKQGRGCHKCGGTSKKTEEDCHNKLKGRSLRMTYYAGTVSDLKSTFECGVCEHVWEASFNDIRMGQGCPSCAKSGFNPSRPAWLYVLRLNTPQGDCYGFGITNVLKDRMRRHKKNLGNMLDEVYEPFYFDSGKDAQELESTWKKSPYIINVGVTGFVTECVLVNSETTKMIFNN